MRKNLIALAVSMAVVVTACGGSSEVASVDGEAISLADVEAVQPQGQGMIDRQQFATDLGFMILHRVLVKAASQDYGVTLDQAGVDASFDEQMLALEAQGDPQEILAQNNLTEGRLKLRLGLSQIIPQVTDKILADLGDPTEADLAAAFQTHRTDNARVCARHILVATQEEADAVFARISGGEDFGDLAAEVGLDGTAQNGGDLGCVSPSQYVPEFAVATLDAPVGELYGPVESGFGWHLIIVDQRDDIVFDDVVETLIPEYEAQRGQTLFDEWLLDRLRTAEVTVAPEYGVWNADEARVVVDQ